MPPRNRASLCKCLLYQHCNVSTFAAINPFNYAASLQNITILAGYKERREAKLEREGVMAAGKGTPGKSYRLYLLVDV